MQTNVKNFPTYGYLMLDFEELDLLPLKKEISSIKSNFHVAEKANNFLAGNIQKEFALHKSHQYTQDLLALACIEYDKTFNYLSTLDFCTQDCPLILDRLWVNFQKNYEFNPLHNHAGVFSFVLWIDIPYDRDCEKKYFKDVPESKSRCGFFEFSYIDNFGTIQSEQIALDKTFNNKGILFPSGLSHQVYPFFSSDEYRISVSGNFKIFTV